MNGYSSGGTQGRPPSGSLKPSGESPGTRKSLPRRKFHFSLFQRWSLASAFQRCTGSTKPDGCDNPRSNVRTRRARVSGSSILGSDGSTLGGSADSFNIQYVGSSKAGNAYSGSTPRR